MSNQGAHRRRKREVEAPRRLLFVKHARRKAGFTSDRMGALFDVKGRTIQSWEGSQRWKSGQHSPIYDFRYAVLLRFAMFASSDIGVRYLQRMEKAVLEAEPWTRPMITLTWLFGRKPPKPDGSWERYWLRVSKSRAWRDKYPYTRADKSPDWVEFKKLWTDPGQIAANLGLKEPDDDGRSNDEE